MDTTMDTTTTADFSHRLATVGGITKDLIISNIVKGGINGTLMEAREGIITDTLTIITEGIIITTQDITISVVGVITIITTVLGVVVGAMLNYNICEVHISS